jgi:hypothetical protein
MNRATTPAVEPGSAPQYFRHGFSGIGAAGDDMAVIAVGRRQIVPPFEHRHRGGASRLLANVQMIVANKLLRVRKFQNRFFEAADQEHSFHHRPGDVVRQWCGHRGPCSQWEDSLLRVTL